MKPGSVRGYAFGRYWIYFSSAPFLFSRWFPRLFFQPRKVEIAWRRWSLSLAVVP